MNLLQRTPRPFVVACILIAFLLLALGVFLEWCNRNSFAYGCQLDTDGVSDRWESVADIHRYFATGLPTQPRCARYPVVLKKIRQTSEKWYLDVRYGGLNKTWWFWKKGKRP